MEERYRLRAAHQKAWLRPLSTFEKVLYPLLVMVILLVSFSSASGTSTQQPGAIVQAPAQTCGLSNDSWVQPEQAYGAPNAQIEVFVDGRLVGSVFSNAFGEWSLLVSVLGATQTLQARACNSFGCGELSNDVRVLFGVDGDSSITSESSCSLKIYLEQYRFSSLPVEKGIDIVMWIEGAEPRFDVVTNWGDVTINNQTLDAQKLTLHHTYN